MAPLWGRGDTYRLLGRHNQAYDDYCAALAHIEAVRGGLKPQPHRLGYLNEDRLVDYERLVRLLADRAGLYRPAESLEFAERARARTFLDLLERTSFSLSQGGCSPGPAADDATLAAGHPQTFESIRSLLL